MVFSAPSPSPAPRVTAPVLSSGGVPSSQAATGPRDAQQSRARADPAGIDTLRHAQSASRAAWADFGQSLGVCSGAFVMQEMSRHHLRHRKGLARFGSPRNGITLLRRGSAHRETRHPGPKGLVCVSVTYPVRQTYRAADKGFVKRPIAVGRRSGAGKQAMAAATRKVPSLAGQLFTYLGSSRRCELALCFSLQLEEGPPAPRHAGERTPVLKNTP